MEISPVQLKSLLSSALKTAIQVKGKDRFIGRSHSNSLRSAKFVSEVADRLFEFYRGDEAIIPFVQRVDESGIKKPGEWLFDISIAESVPLLEGKSKPRVNTRLVWAVESEYSTRREEFTKDFGKLLCARAVNRLYLNGFNHAIGLEGTFIDRRAVEASEFMKRALLYKTGQSLEGISQGNLYLAFWPSPERDPKCSGSLWDTSEADDILKRLRLYAFDWMAAEFKIVL